MNKMLLSQVIALIKVSFDAKAVYPSDGGIWYMKPENITVEDSHSFSVKWKKGRGCGQENMSLHFVLNDIRPAYPHAKKPLAELDKEYVFKIFYFIGDNYNDQTQFIYWLIGNQIDIVDDIGICSFPHTSFSRKHLDKINPFDIRKALHDLKYSYLTELVW